MAKFATNVSGAMLLPSLIQVTESISGSVVPLAMFKLKSRDFSRFFVTVFWTPSNALSPTNLFHFFISVNPVPKIRLARHCDTTDYSAGI